MRPANAACFVTLLTLSGCSGDGSLGTEQDAPQAGGTGGSENLGSGGAGTGGAESEPGSGGAGGVLTGGAATGGTNPETGGSTGNDEFQLPTTNAGFDYQIGGGYAAPAGVAIVSRDREDSPAPGLYNICYVNGFQAQPSDDSWWLSNHPSLILRDESGDPVIDEDWDEMLFDTTTNEKRTALAQVIGGWIQECAEDGFDAIEIDNLDTYSRSGGRISEQNNVAFMKMLSDIGHAAGVAMGQKNSAEILGSANEMGTDFAVAEECNRYKECGDYTAVYGNLVFVIEYRDQDYDFGCANFPELSIVRRDVNVSTPSSGSYVYSGC